VKHVESRETYLAQEKYLARETFLARVVVTRFTRWKPQLASRPDAAKKESLPGGGGKQAEPSVQGIFGRKKKVGAPRSMPQTGG